MRDVDPELLAAFQASSFRPIAAVRLDWPGGEVRYHSRLRTVTLDGDPFKGVGTFGNAEGIAERAGLAVREFTLTLTGFLSDQLAKVHNLKVRNRSAEIYLGAVDASECQIGAQMMRVFRGQMRRVDFDIEDAGVSGYRHSIKVLVQNHLASGRRPVEVRIEHPRYAALRTQDDLTWPE